jgi:hypothetical protein
MLLEDKNAVIYSGGRKVGSAVARSFTASDLASAMAATSINITCGRCRLGAAGRRRWLTFGNR